MMRIWVILTVYRRNTLPVGLRKGKRRAPAVDYDAVQTVNTKSLFSGVAICSELKKFFSKSRFT